jgi:hypothetical protein
MDTRQIYPCSVLPPYKIHCRNAMHRKKTLTANHRPRPRRSSKVTTRCSGHPHCSLLQYPKRKLSLMIRTTIPSHSTPGSFQSHIMRNVHRISTNFYDPSTSQKLLASGSDDHAFPHPSLTAPMLQSTDPYSSKNSSYTPNLSTVITSLATPSYMDFDAGCRMQDARAASGTTVEQTGRYSVPGLIIPKDPDKFDANKIPVSIMSHQRPPSTRSKRQSRVSGLTEQQRQRKRACDREAQRKKRKKQKETVEDLESKVHTLENQLIWQATKHHDEMLQLRRWVCKWFRFSCFKD